MFAKNSAMSAKIGHATAPEKNVYQLLIDGSFHTVARKTSDGFICNYNGHELFSPTLKELKMKFACAYFGGSVKIYTKHKNTIICTQTTMNSSKRFCMRRC